MVLGLLELELQIPAAHSLKEKRMVIRSLRDRIRRDFNVSVAEVDLQDQWQEAVLGVAMVSTDQSFANRVLSKVVEKVESTPEAVLVDYRLQFL